MASRPHIPKPSNGDKINQLSFFELLDPADKDYTQAITLYDCIPKYVSYGRMKAFDESNVSITRPFKLNDKEFNLKITGAIIERPSGSGSTETKQCIVYPGTREELVEDALRKITISRGRTVYDEQGGFCSFTLYELQMELKSTGHMYSYTEIKEALLILHKTGIEISAEGKKLSSGYLLPSLSLTSSAALKENSDAKCIVRFHEMVSISIRDLQFRQMNYTISMSFKSQFARRIFKRISDRWKGASMTSDYGPVLLDTLLRDTGEMRDDTMSNRRRKLKTALAELKEKGVIRDFVLQEIKSGRKTVDIKITLMAAAEYRDLPEKGFVSDTKRANHFENEQKKQIAAIT